MNKLTYYLPNDIHAYKITCNNDMLDMYMDLLFDNGVYKVNLNDKVVFAAKSTYEVWKNGK